MERLKKAKKSVKRRKINIKKIIVLIVVFFCIVFFASKINSNKIEVKQETSLIISNQDVTNTLKNEMIIKDNAVYLSFEDIKKIIDKNIYQEENLLILSGEKKVAVLKLDKKEIEINGAKVSIENSAYKKDDIIYIPISDLKNVYDIELEYIKNSKNVVIDYYSKKLVKAYLTKNIKVKNKIGNFSGVVGNVKKGNWVIIANQQGKWSKIRMQNGNIGYIKNKYLTNFVNERDEFKESEEKKPSKIYTKSISNINIENYKARLKIIEQCLQDAILNKSDTVKFKGKNLNKENLERLKIEATPILKECGISVIFE